MEENQIQGAFNELSAPPSPEPVSLRDAIAIFDFLADRNDIAFGYDSDGCYARAHIMCRMMSSWGLAPKKAWAFESDKGTLYVDKHDGKKTRWCYHVAAVLPVRMPDGNVQDLVFDPGLFDGPVSLKDWGGLMHADPARLEITPCGVPPKGWAGDYEPKYGEATTSETDARAYHRMQEYMQWSAPQRVLFASSTRQQAVQGEPQPKLSGMTWISTALIAQAHSGTTITMHPGTTVTLTGGTPPAEAFTVVAGRGDGLTYSGGSGAPPPTPATVSVSSGGISGYIKRMLRTIMS
jgi:hypothetical protein